MKTDKMKTIMYYMPVIIFLFALISFIAFVAVHSVRQDNLKRCYFCVRETLTRIWHDQYGYHEKFKRYANFTDLAKQYVRNPGDISPLSASACSAEALERHEGART